MGSKVGVITGNDDRSGVARGATMSGSAAMYEALATPIRRLIDVTIRTEVDIDTAMAR
nr:hypothetical protein [Mycobacterium sp. E796]